MSDVERPGGGPVLPPSCNSEDSTVQLINQVKSDKASGKNSAGSKRLLVGLGLGQLVLGVLLISCGAAGVVSGAALARAGAGLWAGSAAVAAGVVGILAGINDCYGLQRPNGLQIGRGLKRAADDTIQNAEKRRWLTPSEPSTSQAVEMTECEVCKIPVKKRGGLVTACLALSLVCLAGGNCAAVLAATGLQRDVQRSKAPLNTFQDEMDAWTPVLSNIALLITAAVHCLLSVITVYHLSKRVCPCFRPKQPYDHNQFEPHKHYIIQVDERDGKATDLCKDLEGKLQDHGKKKKKEGSVQFGSANSKERLVSSWLTAAPAPPPARRRPPGVRKPRKAPLMLLPAHPASTLGRVPACVMVPAPRYATLPLPPAPYAPPHGPIYYPVHDARMRRRRSPRGRGERRRREVREGRGERGDSQLTRSLERIHRKRRADRDRLSDAELKRTYTGLDRAYAEQFIAVCDESRHHAEQHDSLASTSATSDTSHTST